jgi:hypothetical protein
VLLILLHHGLTLHSKWDCHDGQSLSHGVVKIRNSRFYKWERFIIRNVILCDFSKRKAIMQWHRLHHRFCRIKQKNKVCKLVPLGYNVQKKEK